MATSVSSLTNLADTRRFLGIGERNCLVDDPLAPDSLRILKVGIPQPVKVSPARGTQRERVLLLFPVRSPELWIVGELGIVWIVGRSEGLLDKTSARWTHYLFCLYLFPTFVANLFPADAVRFPLYPWHRGEMIIPPRQVRRG